VIYVAAAQRAPFAVSGRRGDTDWPWRGEPLTSDFEDATLLSRSYRVGSVNVPGQPRWLKSICGEQDDPLPTLP
jgi:hypothetical protein